MSFFGRLLASGIDTDGTNVKIPGLSQAVGRGKVFYVDAANGSATGNAISASTALNSLTLAYDKMVTGRHDIVKLIPSTSSISLASSLTWAKNFAHLIGDGAVGRMNMRSRIGHSANFTPLMTISGYGCSFQNLYFMHGRGSATNLVGISITGGRNEFHNVHFGGPMHATEGDTSGYTLVSVASAENYFKDCFFGVDSVAFDDGALVKFNAGGDNSQRTIFENCIFLMNAAASPACFFLDTAAGLGEATAIFLNCQFINSGTALDYAIGSTGLGNFQIYFDNRCSFAGVTDIVAAAAENYVWFGGVNMPINQVNTASVALFNGIACHPDVS